VEASPAPATFNAAAHRQRLAVAWLRETGEHRPAIEILESEANLSSEFRRELARWMKRGCKRKKGYPEHPNLRKVLPPTLAAKAFIATPGQTRAWMAYLGWKVQHGFPMSSAPRKAHAALVQHVIKSAEKHAKVSKRTAQLWVARFERETNW
jgi:hypothetical protein